MQNGGSCTCKQNEYLFYGTAIFTLFWAICCKIHCVLVLNTLRFGAKWSAFGAKWSAFWCKTQGKMVLNAVQFAAKRKALRINIR